MQERKRIEMMGLQAAIKTTKRKYEIEADCEADKKEEASPPKTIKYSEAKTITINGNVSSTYTVQDNYYYYVYVYCY